MSSTSDTWKTVGIRIGVIILLGAAVALVVIVILSIISRNSPCKDSTTCPAYQVCGGGGHCVSLPGYRCTLSSQCSIYGPVCSKGLYCTNFSNQPRGTAGNPARDKEPRCDPGLTLNPVANLCQQPAIGARCTIDAECNQGLCNQTSKTCQFAGRCSTDRILNPYQCMPPYECDDLRLQCTTPGTTPGADGTPCNSSSDCGIGSTCISGPPASGFSGVCRAGDLTWLTMVSDQLAKCMTPLTGELGYCRYDVKDFMQCTTIAQCQYPYAKCDTNLQVCVPESLDPIDPSKFLYSPVGVSPSVRGGFYNVTYATTPAEVDNATGGKLIDQYTGFLPSGQFEDQPEFQGRQLVTFTSLTSFAVVSFAVASDPPAPPQAPYYGAIFEDPNPMLAMTSIVQHAGDPGNSILIFSFYNQGYTVPNFFPQMNIWVGRIVFPTIGARIWNPSAIAAAMPGINPVAFVPNPIVTPWIDIKPTGVIPLLGQNALTHSLFYANDRYCIGFLSANVGLGGNAFQASGVFSPALSQTTGNAVYLSSDILVITAWDILTTYVAINNFLGVYSATILLYGLHISGNYMLFTAQIQLDQRDHNIFIIDQPVNVASDQFLITPAGISNFRATQYLQARLSRSQSPLAEPLLLITFFTEEAAGLGITTFAIDSLGASMQFDSTNACTRQQILEGVTSLKYVTPVTGAYGYGAFVVWCSTIETSSAFLLVQVRGFCNNNVPAIGEIFSMIYWRRITGEPSDYYMYPIGGASLPYFLATDLPLTFDGVPNLLPPIST